MRYLILGSSGQVGDALCAYYELKGHAVDRFDIAADAKEDLRIDNDPLLYNKMEEADFVFFLAFDVGGSRYLKKYEKTFSFMHNNIKIMSNTFSMLERTKKPFIFTSTQMSNMGHSSYGSLKKIGEWYTKILGGIVVKFWNVYGIEPDLEKSHVITDFILKARDTGVIDMLTDGTEKRQFLYSEDCCEALDAVCNNYVDIDRDEEMHITTHEWSSILEVAHEVVNNFPAEIVPGENKDTLQKGKVNEADPYILNFWKPKTSLAEGIRRVCEYYEE
jgi:nucleoside-diphosphate-sugar epimerase|tara:strand:+ start:677 stop:1501 length:825 start_codon:yes stop_codon:yes gene_type:complete